MTYKKGKDGKIYQIIGQSADGKVEAKPVDGPQRGKDGSWYEIMDVDPSGKLVTFPAAAPVVLDDTLATTGDRVKAGFAPSEQGYYAKKYGADNVRDLDGEVQLRHPETGKWHQVDQEGFLGDVAGDLGDLTREVAPGILGVAGNIVGAGAGLLSGGPAGAYVGTATGGALGTTWGESLNQGISGWLGLDDRTTAEKAGDLAKTFAYTQAAELALPVAGKYALKAAKPVAKKAGSLLKSGAVNLTSAATGMPPAAIKQIVTKAGDRTHEMIGEAEQFIEPAAKMVRDISARVKSQAGQNVSDTLAQVVPQGQPMDTSGAVARITGLLNSRNVLNADGTINAYSQVGKQSEREQLLAFRKMIAEAPTLHDLNNWRIGLDDNINWATSSKQISGLIKQIRGIVDDEITHEVKRLNPEGAAKYLEAKQAYGKIAEQNAAITKNLAESKNGANPRFDTKIRNIHGKANRVFKEHLEDLAKASPEAQAAVDDIFNIPYALQWDSFVPDNKMDGGRLPAGILAGMAMNDPTSSLLGYAATRPKVVEPVLYHGGKAVRETAEKLGKVSPVRPIYAAFDGVQEVSDAGVNKKITYHGSPHQFDRFDHSKMGTGEGVQAYGWGTYLADSDKVAGGYQKRLSGQGTANFKKADGTEFDKSKDINAGLTEADGQKWAAQNTALNYLGSTGNYSEAREFLTALKNDNRLSRYEDKWASAIDELDAFERSGLTVSKEAGHFYKVDLPDEAIANMLDWDKPLREQSPHVQSVLRGMAGDRADMLMGNNWTGGDFYQRWLGGSQYQDTGEEMSEMLAELGIPGIKYLDGSSRSAGKGTSNYVVFNEDTMKILQRNGKPVGSGGNAITKKITYHGSPYPFDRFDHSKMGSGEGAQVFGWGTYLADVGDVAKGYRERLSANDMRRKFLNNLPRDAEFEDVTELMGSGRFSPEQERVIKALVDDDWLGFDHPSQAISAAYNEIANFDASKELVEAVAESGHFYKVDLPDDKIAQMLDWDKPLNEQPKQIQDIVADLRANSNSHGVSGAADELELLADNDYGLYQKRDLIQSLIDQYKANPNDQSVRRQIASHYREYAKSYDGDILANLEAKVSSNFGDGEGVYRALTDRLGSDKAASQYLDSLGIPGIKYSDGMSRGKSGGTSNYVIFNENTAKILQRNGKPVGSDGNAVTKSMRGRGGSKVVEYDGGPWALESEIAKLQKQFPNTPQVKIMTNKGIDNTDAFLMTKPDGTKEVWFNPHQIKTKEQLREAFLHEVVGHEGLWRNSSGEIVELVARVKRSHGQRIRHFIDQGYTAAEAPYEVIAELAEKGLDTGTLKGVVRDSVKRLRDQFNKNTGSELSKNDILRLLADSERTMRGSTLAKDAAKQGGLLMGKRAVIQSGGGLLSQPNNQGGQQ